MTSDPHSETHAVPPPVGHCARCGYDLRGLPENRCPECGTRFVPEDINELNTLWCGERIVGLRIAAMVLGIALCAGVLGVPDPSYKAVSMLLFVFMIAAAALIQLLLRRGFSRFWSNLTGNLVGDAWNRAFRRFGVNLIGIAAAAVVLAIASMAWPILRLLLLLLGLSLASFELRQYHLGHRLGRLMRVEERGVRVLQAAHQVTIILACLCAVLLMTLIALLL